MSRSIRIRLHAKRQLKERRIPEDLVKKVLLHPGQVVNSYSGRKVAQDIIEYSGTQFLVRVIYEEIGNTLKVVTAYFTTKIEKYWR